MKRFPTIAAALMGLAVAGLAAPAQAQPADGLTTRMVGEWQVQCRNGFVVNGALRPLRFCTVLTAARPAGYDLIIQYSPGLLTVREFGVPLAATAQVDGGTAQYGQCQRGACDFEDQDFNRAMASGTSLIVKASKPTAPDMKPVTVRKSLAELRRAWAMARDWMAGKAADLKDL